MEKSRRRFKRGNWTLHPSLIADRRAEPRQPARGATMELLDANDPNWPVSPLDIDLTDGTWLTPQQAAAVARISERTLWRWLRDRDISIKVGGRLWISKRRLFGQ